MTALAGVPDLDVAAADSTEAFLAALDGAQAAVLPGLPRFYGPEVGAKIASSPDMAWVHLISAGHDGVDAAGWPPGVRFTHPGGALSGAVAEHAFALLAALSRQLDKAVLGQTRQAWGKPYAQQATTLSGATLAVVGFGSIGRRVAKLASGGYDMTVIGVSRSGRPVDGYEVHPVSALLDVLPRADAGEKDDEAERGRQENDEIAEIGDEVHQEPLSAIDVYRERRRFARVRHVSLNRARATLKRRGVESPRPEPCVPRPDARRRRTRRPTQRNLELH